MCVCGGVGSVHVCVCTTFGQWAVGVYASNSLRTSVHVFWDSNQSSKDRWRGSSINKSFVKHEVSSGLCMSISMMQHPYVPPFVLYYWVHTAGMYLIELEVGPEVVLPRRHTDSVNNLFRETWLGMLIGWLVRQSRNATLQCSGQWECVHSPVSGKCSAM